MSSVDGDDLIYDPNQKRDVAKETLALGYVFQDLKLPVAVNRVNWGSRIRACFQHLMEVSRDTNQDRGRLLPYSTLRAVLQTRLNGLIFLDGELGSPWVVSEKQPYTLAEIADVDEAVVRKTVRDAVRLWTTKILTPWAQDLGLNDEEIAEEISELIEEEGALEFMGADRPGTIDLRERPFQSSEGFRTARRLVAAALVRELSGKEIFPGLGPVRYVVPSRLEASFVELETWPLLHLQTAYSMVARFTIKTAPGVPGIVVTPKATRRVWCRDVPHSSRLKLQRRCQLHLMLEDHDRFVVTSPLPVVRGVPSFDVDPALLLENLKHDELIPKDLSDAIKEFGTPNNNVFVGIPHSPRYGSAQVGGGASTHDQIHLFGTVADLLYKVGAEKLNPLVFKPGDKDRPLEHRKLDEEHLFFDFLQGFDDSDPLEEIVDLWQDETGSVTETFDADTLATNSEILTNIRQVNAERVKAAHGNKKPSVLVMSGDKKEHTLIYSCIRTLFGDSVSIDNDKPFPLPPGAHGLKDDLHGIRSPRVRDRYGIQYEKWRETAEIIHRETQATHVLVQARQYYGPNRTPDDSVNKLAGRAALARLGDVNSQWLNPPDDLPPRARKNQSKDLIKEYLYRVQSAVFDLILGHAGGMDPFEKALTVPFEDEAQPRQLIGFSCLTLKKTKFGKGGRELLVAFKLNKGEGRSYARCAFRRENGDPHFSSWEPFADFLKSVAGEDTYSLGRSYKDKSNLSQMFFKEVIEEAIDAKAKPLVLFDGSSLRGFWPFLNNKQDMPPSITFPDIEAGQYGAKKRWKNVRIVRVRTDQAGVIADQHRTRLENDARISIEDSITPNIAELSRWENGGLYWDTVGYPPKSGERGRSVYRPVFRLARKSNGIYRIKPELTYNPKDPYRLPGVLEVSVVQCLPNDDSQKIASAVHGLRSLAAHHGSITTLPSPLAFMKRVEDYVPRFELIDHEDLEDSGDDLDGEAEETDLATTNEEVADSTDDTEASEYRRRESSFVRMLLQSTNASTTKFELKAPEDLDPYERRKAIFTQMIQEAISNRSAENSSPGETNSDESVLEYLEQLDGEDAEEAGDGIQGYDLEDSIGSVDEHAEEVGLPYREKGEPETMTEESDSKDREATDEAVSPEALATLWDETIKSLQAVCRKIEGSQPDLEAATLAHTSTEELVRIAEQHAVLRPTELDLRPLADRILESAKRLKEVSRKAVGVCEEIKARSAELSAAEILVAPQELFDEISGMLDGANTHINAAEILKKRAADARRDQTIDEDDLEQIILDLGAGRRDESTEAERLLWSALASMPELDNALSQTEKTKEAASPPANEGILPSDKTDELKKEMDQEESGPLVEGAIDVFGMELDDDSGHDIAVSSDGEEDVNLEEIAELERQLAEENQSDELDDEVEVINDRLWNLLASDEFGQAFHLSKSTNHLFGHGIRSDLAFTTEELEIIAQRGVLRAVTTSQIRRQDRLFASLTDVARELCDGPDRGSDLSKARRLFMSSALLEAALFPSLEASVQLLDSLFETLTHNGTGAAFFGYGKIVEHIRKHPGEFTEADLHLQTSNIKESNLREARMNSSYHFDLLQKGRWNFKSAEQIRSALIREGPFRDFFESLEADKPQEAYATIRKFNDDSRVGEFLDSEADRIGVKQLVREGRERFISKITSVVSAAAEWAEIDAALKRKNKNQDFRTTIARGIVDTTNKVLEALNQKRVESQEPIYQSALRYAESRLNSLLAKAEGTETLGLSNEQKMVALHSPLLWVDGLHYAGPWEPSPYDPQKIFDAIMDQRIPFRPKRFDSNAVKERIKELRRSHCIRAARLLLKVASYSGVDEKDRASLGEKIETDAIDMMDHLGPMIEERQNQLIRLQRFALEQFSAHDDKTIGSLQSRIDSLKSVSAEAFSIDNELTESSSERVFNDPSTVLSEVDWIDRAFEGIIEGPRQDLYERARKAFQETEPEALHEVHDLLYEKGDLATALERIELSEDIGALKSGIVEPTDFDRYYPKYPDLLIEADVDLDEIGDCLKKGRDFGPLTFSKVEDRDDAQQTLGSWKTARRRIVSSSQKVASVLNGVIDFLSQCGARCSRNGSDNEPGFTNRAKRQYACDIDLDFPRSEDSLILPDFGSRANGAWKLAVVQRLPGKPEFRELCRLGTQTPVLLVVLNAVSSQKREEYACYAKKEQLRAIVVDQTLFLYALSQKEFRFATMIEVAQAFCYSNPYGDFGNDPVPSELFVGRETETNKIIDTNTGFYVYGGRRLGKTALLRNIAAVKHDEKRGFVVGYETLYSMQGRSVWEMASEKIPAVFDGKTIGNANDFSKGVKKWLEADSRHRILLLLDECNEFLEEEVSAPNQEFKTVNELHRLMSETQHRFKVVFAGLQKLSRFVDRIENYPARFQEHSVLRIGPLRGEDMPAAERLVTKPLAGMGYRFAVKSDVWRLLNACLYYPVLTQLACQVLVDKLADRAGSTEQIDRVIDSQTVSETLDAQKTKEMAQSAFDLTLKLDKERYRLVTLVVADWVIMSQRSNQADMGMAPRELKKEAGKYWPVVFSDQAMTDSEFQAIIDEMEGLGLLKKLEDNHWTLRTRQLLPLLGDIDAELVSFLSKPKPESFDMRMARRVFTAPKSLNRKIRSPLNFGETTKILTGPAHISLVLGLEIAGLKYVPSALQDVAEYGDVVGIGQGGRKPLKVEIFSRRTLTELGNLLREQERELRDVRPVVVVTSDSPWTAEWVRAVSIRQELSSGPDPGARFVFVGGPSQSHDWIHATDKPVGENLNLITLVPWRLIETETFLKQSQIGDATEMARDIHNETGGWNLPMSHLFLKDDTKKSRLRSALSKANADVRKETLETMGLSSGPIRTAILKFFEEGWADEKTPISRSIFLEFIDDQHLVESALGESILEYLRLLGLIDLLPSTDGNMEDYAVNPLLLSKILDNVREPKNA